MRRIGLTQRVEVVPDRDERRDALDQAWFRVIAARGWLPVPLPNHADAAATLVDELGLDGVILTGGNDLASIPGARTAAPDRDAFEEVLLKCCQERDLPVLGVCRGMQFLLSHSGATPVPVDGHVATIHPISVEPKSAMPLDGRCEVNSFHDFGVLTEDLPQDWSLAAHSSDGIVEAIVHHERPWWGILWHPERGPEHPGDVAILEACFSQSAAKRRGE